MESRTKQNDYSLIGKKGVLTFPEMKAEVSYISGTTLHWKTTDSEGIVSEGGENINYEKLSDNIHFLNWIEKDGWTVSQIISGSGSKIADGKSANVPIKVKHIV